MALRGFSREVLIEILENLAIKELATATERWELTQVVEKSTSLFRIGLEARIANLDMYWDRLRLYTDRINNPESGDDRSSVAYKSSVKILQKLIKDTVLATKDYQSEIYDKEHNIYNSHSMIEFPLDKKPGLNALYDDFSAVFLFYDNISTVGKNLGALVHLYHNDLERMTSFINTFIPDEKELASKLLKAETADQAREIWVKEKGMDSLDYFESLGTEDRIKYIRDNIKFTHCLLGGANNPNWAIGVYGELDKTLSSFTEGRQQVLPCEYSDFEKTTLADTLKIKNQDLMQIMQSKINIDRENLEVVDEKVIGGDSYRLVKLPQTVREGGSDVSYLIRFVCPSTQRVYHVSLIESMLRSSNIYKDGDVKTYLEAWWHITHGGLDPRECEYVIRT